MTILTAVIVIGGVMAFVSWLHARTIEATDDAFIDGHIITISPKVSGIVQNVYVNDNQAVKQGQVLLQLDPRDYQAALDEANANLAAAQGKFQEAQTQVPVTQAEVGEAQAELIVAQTNADNAQDDLNRYLALDERARSKQQLDDATSAQKSAAAQVEQAKAKLTSAQAQVDEAKMAVVTAQANVESAKAAVDQAKLNLGYCTIVADTDGLITRKSVEPGMYVQVDEALFSIVLRDVWVTANFKETQLDSMVAGQPVEISVDAFPGRKLTGKVDSIQDGTGARFALLPPENATGNYVKVVQRVPVKIVLDPGQNDDDSHLLSPGMSVEPEVKVR